MVNQPILRIRSNRSNAGGRALQAGSEDSGTPHRPHTPSLSQRIS